MRRAFSTAAVLLALIAAGCAPSDTPDFSRPRTIALTDGSQAVDRGSADAEDAVTITMGEFFFEPTVIRAPAGSVLEIELVNAGDNVHNFEGGGVDVTVAERDRDTVTVTVPGQGAFTFACKFHLPNHMRGEVRAA